MYGFDSEKMSNSQAVEEQRALRSLVAAVSRRELNRTSSIPRASPGDLERETEKSQRDAAAVLAYVRNRQADRAHAGLTDVSNLNSSAMAQVGIARPGYGAERPTESVSDSHAWIRRDSQLVRDERAASLLASSASAASAAKTLAEAIEIQGEWYPNQGSIKREDFSSFLGSTPAGVARKKAFLPSPSATSTPTADAIRHISAVRQISALETEVSALELEIVHKKAMLDATISGIRGKEEEIQRAHLHIPPGVIKITESLLDRDIHNTYDVDNNATSRAAAEARGRLATASAIQQSLLGSLKTTRAIHAVESALNVTHRKESGGVCPSLGGENTSWDGGQERELKGLAPPPPTSPCRLSSRLSPSYLEEMAALVERLEADAAVVSTVAREKSALEEQIMQSERTVQQKRKAVCDYRVGIFTGLGPAGEGFCSAAAKREEGGNPKGGAFERNGNISNLGGDLTQLVEKIAGEQHHNSSALWRDSIRSIYASFAELEKGHSSNSHSRHSNNSRTALSCVTLVLSDLSHLSETLDRARVTDHFHLAEREHPQGYTPFVSLSVQKRMAYFNRKHVCNDEITDSWLSETAGTSYESQSGDKGFTSARGRLRYETSACIPKLAEEALRPRFLANTKGTHLGACKEGDEANRTATTESTKEASNHSTLWGSISDVPPKAYGSCIILLPSGALGALSKRIKDLSPQSSLRTLAVANYGIKSSDVSVVNHANQATDKQAAERQGGWMPSAHSPSPHSREDAGPFASEITIRGYLQQQVLPFAASLISPQLLPATYAADSRVLVPDFLTVLGAERKVFSTTLAPKPFDDDVFHEAKAYVSASSFSKRFGNRFVASFRANKSVDADSSFALVSQVVQTVADGNGSRIPLEETATRQRDSDPRHVDAVEIAVADLLLSLFGRS